MKLLLVSQYFYPESFMINDVVRVLVEEGHEVVVLTGKPNYPEGRVFPGYRSWNIQRESFLGQVPVIRLPIFTRGNGGALRLIMNYLSFVFSGLLLGPFLLKGQQFDHILVFAPSPPTQAIPALFIKWLKKVPLTMWVQDLWPETLSDTGYIKHPFLLGMAGVMMRHIYARCDHLLVPSLAFRPSISRYADEKKIIYFPNLMDTEKSKRDAHSNRPLPDELKTALGGAFTVVFAGNTGIAQSMETLVEAAQIMQKDPDIRFVVIGSGSRLDWMRQEKKRLGLDNLVLTGRYPPEMMPEVFKHASALLVSLKKGSAFCYTIPSKTQTYMAAGRPVIAARGGEGARLRMEAGACVCCPPEDASALAQAIWKLSHMTENERQSMGRSGQQYFDDHFEMRPQIARLITILTEDNRETLA